MGDGVGGVADNATYSVIVFSCTCIRRNGV